MSEERHYAWKCASCSRGELESSWQNAIYSARDHQKKNPSHSVIAEASRRLVLEAPR